MRINSIQRFLVFLSFDHRMEHLVGGALRAHMLSHRALSWQRSPALFML